MMGVAHAVVSYNWRWQ